MMDRAENATLVSTYSQGPLACLQGGLTSELATCLFTTLLVLAPCMILGVMRPVRPWRWVVVVGICVPLVVLGAYLLSIQKPTHAQVYESFLAFLPGIAGAYGGALLRRASDNIFSGR